MGGLTFDGEGIAFADAGDDAELFAVEDGGHDAHDPRMDAFCGFLIELAHMGTTARESIFGLLGKRTLKEIAEPLGVTMQAIGAAQQTAMKRLPILRALLSRKNSR